MKVSVIIPVLNEGDRINPLTGHIRSIPSGRSVEIIVVDGDEKGGTIGRIEDREVRGLTSPRGRGVQMNRGAAAAAGEVLLFLHADTVLPENAFGLIIEALEDSSVAGGAFGLMIDGPGFLLKLTGFMASLKHRFTRVPFGDQAIFLRREYFNEIGGYREIPIMEDVELMRRIKKRGGRIRILPMKVLTSPRKWMEDGIVYTIARNWILQTLFMFGVPPERLVRYYYRRLQP